MGAESLLGYSPGRLHWCVVKFLSLGTWGTCDCEIRAVFLAEDRTLKVEGFSFDLYHRQPVLST